MGSRTVVATIGSGVVGTVGRGMVTAVDGMVVIVPVVGGGRKSCSRSRSRNGC